MSQTTADQVKEDFDLGFGYADKLAETLTIKGCNISVYQHDFREFIGVGSVIMIGSKIAIIPNDLENLIWQVHINPCGDHDAPWDYDYVTHKNNVIEAVDEGIMTLIKWEANMDV